MVLPCVALVPQEVLRPGHVREAAGGQGGQEGRPQDGERRRFPCLRISGAPPQGLHHRGSSPQRLCRAPSLRVLPCACCPARLLFACLLGIRMSSAQGSMPSTRLLFAFILHVPRARGDRAPCWPLAGRALVVAALSSLVCASASCKHWSPPPSAEPRAHRVDGETAHRLPTFSAQPSHHHNV